LVPVLETCVDVSTLIAHIADFEKVSGKLFRYRHIPVLDISARMSRIGRKSNCVEGVGRIKGCRNGVLVAAIGSTVGLVMVKLPAEIEYAVAAPYDPGWGWLSGCPYQVAGKTDDRESFLVGPKRTAIGPLVALAEVVIHSRDALVDGEIAAGPPTRLTPPLRAT
jgi:hypothetical protein